MELNVQVIMKRLGEKIGALEVDLEVKNEYIDSLHSQIESLEKQISEKEQAAVPAVEKADE